MKTPVLVGYGLAALVVIASTVLHATGHSDPSWFESLAIFAAGGSTGALLPSRTDAPTP